MTFWMTIPEVSRYDCGIAIERLKANNAKTSSDCSKGVQRTRYPQNSSSNLRLDENDDGPLPRYRSVIDIASLFEHLLVFV